MTEELIEKKSEINLKEENDPVRIIKQISPSNIKEYSNEYLISLINQEKIFFDIIEYDALKCFNKKVINSLSKNNINNLSKLALQKLTNAEKIYYLDKKFLNYINNEYFSQLPNNFYKQINENQFYNTEDKIIFELVKLKKIENFKKTILKEIYKTKIIPILK